MVLRRCWLCFVARLPFLAVFGALWAHLSCQIAHAPHVVGEVHHPYRQPCPGYAYTANAFASETALRRKQVLNPAAGLGSHSIDSSLARTQRLVTMPSVLNITAIAPGLKIGFDIFGAVG